MTMPRITVIIATTLERSRLESLRRALNSVLATSSGDVLPLLVVNGQQFEQRALDDYQSRDDVKVIYLEEANFAKARLNGRLAVETEYFSFLDDDDEYLPGAIQLRLQLLEETPEADCVVTNGHYLSESTREVAKQDLHNYEAEPLIALATTNWLGSCAGTFRTASVSEDYFPIESRYMEWTATAFLLANDRKIKILFTNEYTFQVNDSEGSLSKSPTYHLAESEVLQWLINRPMTHLARKAWQQKLSRSLHALANVQLKEGRKMDAWKAHMRSLLLPGGYRYLSFTRHLLF